MTHILIDHEVESYEAWKPAFDEHDATRIEHGQQRYQLFQSADVPNHVVATFEFDTMEHARSFIESDDLREKMQEAGVKGEPTITFLDLVEQRDVAQPSA